MGIQHPLQHPYIARRFSQSGRHDPLTTRFGLGSDQVLEWEVVTATGKHFVASLTEKEVFYWALSGGGGTYAAVLSTTVTAHADFKVASANPVFTNAGILDDEFYDVIKTLLMSLPTTLDAGIWSVWQLSPGLFVLIPILEPELRQVVLQALLQPTLASLNAKGISYSKKDSGRITYTEEANDEDSL
ncbi:hypothetical protein DL764_000240 [Monosporascus ibericus]|uniref:Uncharacterized protein n=1 Tax=Monosporascus ibericus TaxID=155417 RepID=A0A4Q4TW08_9PEZI|nr:hypothetical protein DL764_000240 [Monosporascus ibericus]